MLKWTVTGREGSLERRAMEDTSLDITEDPLAAFSIANCYENNKVYCINR